MNRFVAPDDQLHLIILVSKTVPRPSFLQRPNTQKCVPTATCCVSTLDRPPEAHVVLALHLDRSARRDTTVSRQTPPRLDLGRCSSLQQHHRLFGSSSVA